MDTDSINNKSEIEKRRLISDKYLNKWRFATTIPKPFNNTYSSNLKGDNKSFQH